MKALETKILKIFNLHWLFEIYLKECDSNISILQKGITTIFNLKKKTIKKNVILKLFLVRVKKWLQAKTFFHSS